jgi:FtsH-binding integral membrane protein
MSLSASHTTEIGESGVFGQVMGLVAATLGFLTLGAYLGRDLAGGPSFVCFILGFLCIVGLSFVRDSGALAVGLLFAAGLLLGLGLGGSLDGYGSGSPGAVWQAAAATGLFVAALGGVGYAIRSDLSGGYRVLFLLLLALVLYGLVTLFVSMPGGNVVYALLGLGIFGGYTVLDFNRMRRAGTDDAVWIASGIFVDVLNVFTFFLQLFGRGRG